MKKLIQLTIVTALTIILFACDKIDNPIIKSGDYRSDLYGNAPAFVPVETPLQNVLLEDFTGHDCGNCPIAHGIAYGILDNNPERVAMVAIHAGSLGGPNPPLYPANWTTPEGTYYLLTQVGADEMPKGRMNRTPDSHIAYSPGGWVNRTNTALAATPQVHLQLATNYNADNKHLSVHVNHQWFQGLSGDYRLVIMLTESHIIAPQLWYGHTPEHVDEYEHNHMLRTTLTGATGRVVASNPGSGLNTTNSYTIDWKDEWNAENCEVIAFITEGEDGRVLNCAHRPLVD